MFIERYGSGPRTFLGLHGWNGDHRTFLPLTSRLPAGVSFYALDLPGCGRSPGPSRWSVDSIADQIAETAARVPAPFTLVGNCSGALLGLEVARRMSGAVERMVLIDMFAFFPWYFRLFLVPAAGPFFYWSTFANPFGRWIANVSLRGRRTAETTLTGGFAMTNHVNTYRYLSLFKNFPAPECHSELEMPVDIVYGERTFQAVKESAVRWKKIWPQATAHCLAGAGHLPILEATSQLREILFRKALVASECPTTSTTIAS